MLGPCLGRVLVPLQGSWPAAGRVRVRRGLQVLALVPCQGLVLVRVQGSWPAADRVRGRTERQAPVLGPCLGQVQVRVQGSWPAADLQASGMVLSRRSNTSCVIVDDLEPCNISLAPRTP